MTDEEDKLRGIMSEAGAALRLVLRIGGWVMLSAALAVLLPTEWMAAIHRWLGLGEYPHTPLVEYLTRSISALYVIHGGILLLAASDVRRFAPLVRYLGVTTFTMGIVLLAIDIYAGLPWLWIVVEGPLVMIIGLMISILLKATGHR